jgi:AcrR family transcriptional regulator
MVEAVARHGYAGTTLRELVALAGVSKSTFYQHFKSKEDCFLATSDEIVRQLGMRVGDAYRSGGDFRDRLTAGLTAFMNLAVDEPAAASLTAVESLTLGAAGVAHRERASQAFEALIQQSFDHAHPDRPVSATTVRAIVAGIRGVAYRRLRSGDRDELPTLVGDLVEWTLRYQEPDNDATRRAVAAATIPLSGAVPVDLDVADPLLSWDEPPDSERSRESLTQRERIVRGAARVVVQRGYPALSIPAISGTAGVSNQTFYEHFANKQEPFLAAFEILASEAFGRTAAAFQAAGDRPEAIGMGLRALLQHVAAKPLFARLAFFELPTAGPTALDRADAILDSFSGFLAPGTIPTEIGGPLPKAVLEAVASGIWEVIQHEISHDRRDSLPDMGPEVTRIVMASFHGT